MNIPTFSKNSDPALRKLDRFIEWFLLTLILCVTLLVCCSCGSTKVVTQTVRDVSIDTIYLSNVQYDSIYIYQDHVSEHHLGTLEPSETLKPDTLYIKDVSIEYRYRLLRDTVYQTRVDSIPVIREVEVVREVRHIPWYAKLLSWIGTLALLFLLIRVLRYLRLRDFP